MVNAAHDPRQIVTPDAFSVAPELLGTRLAHPWRRAAAMAVDGIAIAIVGQLGWIFVGAAVTFLLLRAALRRGVERSSLRRAATALAGVLVLAGTVAGIWVSCFSEGQEVRREMSEAIVTRSLGDAGAFIREGISLVRGDDEAELREAARSFADRLARQGAAPAEIRSTLEELAAQRSEPWARAAILSAIPGAAEPVPRPADSLVIAYAEALETEDSARAAELRDPVVEALAADRFAEQERRIVRLQRENQNLEERLEEERDQGLIRLLLTVADEVGLGLGWAGFYFTLFVAVWGGRTPGKRLLGIRIVRLDGQPIGWWVAFNRFGGYAASIFTGLLGFFEMLWDANRQALHDRIAATVVVREGAPRASSSPGSRRNT